MRALLCGINARNIHASPALYSLIRYAQEHDPGCQLQLREYALHTPTQHILADIYDAHPDLLGFSMYIWNAGFISQLLSDLRKLLPRTRIILGGPEASCRAEYYLHKLPVDAICIGEGEESFTALLQAMKGQEAGAELPVVKGFLLKDNEAAYRPAAEPDLDRLPFLYDEATAAMLGRKHKLVYYESSRGCPYSCSFCASARSRIRERSLDKVMEELPKLAEIGGQVKFIDRTFNASRKRALAISQRILELARPGLSWHFEVSPFGLCRELVDLWNSAPAGYLHLEMGVQTLYGPALDTVGRYGSWDKAEPLVKELIDAGRCHVHLDLISGLPNDTPEGFAASFHRLHQLSPDYLQFGFLKVLPGSLLAEQAERLGLVYSEEPPYQILCTPDMPPEYLFRLHRAERVFNALYNKTDIWRPQLLEAARRCGDALSLYFKAAELAPAERGLNTQEAERIAESIIAF